MYKMIEKQFENTQISETKYFYLYPECLTAQFLLPCFVASFLDLCKEKNVPQAEKDQYMRFVHELILSYERHPFNQLAVPGCAASNFIADLSMLNLKVLEKATALYRCFNRYFGNNYTLSNFHFKCVEYLKKDNFQLPHDPRLRYHEIDETFRIQECHWYSYLNYFHCRVSKCLLKLNWMTVEPDVEFHSHLFIIGPLVLFPFKKGTLHYHLQALINFRAKKFNFSLEEGDINFTVDITNIPTQIRMAADKLSMKQLLTLSIYLSLKNLDVKKDPFIHQVFPLDKSSQIFGAIMSNQKWQLKLLMVSARNEVEDFSLATYQFAKNNICYELALEMLTSIGQVKMKYPGEITFCPIKHCRWCGQADVKTFRVCPECKDYPEYPDLNFFCSEECEKQCLAKQHIEEHAQYLIMLIGLVD